MRTKTWTTCFLGIAELLWALTCWLKRPRTLGTRLMAQSPKIRDMVTCHQLARFWLHAIQEKSLNFYPHVTFGYSNYWAIWINLLFQNCPNLISLAYIMGSWNYVEHYFKIPKKVFIPFQSILLQDHFQLLTTVCQKPGTTYYNCDDDDDDNSNY